MFYVGFFIVFGLFLSFSHISATTIFNESFEDCAVGILNGQCNWIGNATTSAIATTTEHYEGLKSAYWDSSNVGFVGITSYQVGTSLATGTLSFWFKIKSAGGGESVWWEASQSTTPNTPSAFIRFTSGTLAYYTFGSGYTNFCTSLSLDTWYNTQIQWKASDDTINYYCGKTDVWTGWVDNSQHDFDTLGVITFRSPDLQTGLVKIYIDWFYETPLACSNFTNSYDCQTAGCSWHYGNPLLTPDLSFCGDLPTGNCGSGLWDCPNCLTQATCEAQTCYWYQNLCTYTGAICGEGLLTQFCENEADCTTAGGFWYTDFCWLSAKPSNLLDWASYYDENGDYATPTAWITGVASSTTEFFESIGGFLTTFSDNFNLTDAYEKGGTFGNAIPLARSYLTILDQFTGTLPFGDFFIFLLIFTLAVGVFRIVRNLFQLLKFW
jgi:hypothetical protein